MSLEELLVTGLPLNRKERYFTGTVLPMIALADGGRHLDRLLALIRGYRPQPIEWDPARANIQFFTEYSFVESVYGASRARFPIPPTSKDTPDVMILIDGEQRVLIAIEAKMFHNPHDWEIQKQLLAQSVILDYLREQLALDVVHHVALLPEQLARRCSSLTTQVITWEQVYRAYADGRDEDHWLALLRIALERYDDLVARGSMSSFGANNEEKLTGAEIVRRWESGSAPAVMGRNRGLDGPEIEQDLATGRWRTQRYETRSEGPPPNRNWFEVERFVARIQR